MASPRSVAGGICRFAADAGYQSPSNSPTAFRSSTRSHTAFTAIITGMPSSRPHRPHSQPQASTLTNTATGLMLLVRLVSQGVSRLPTRVWMTSDAPPMARAMSRVPNCRKATRADAPVTRAEPM